MGVIVGSVMPVKRPLSGMVLFMLKVETSLAPATNVDTPASPVSNAGLPQVVEVGLLLPINWANALIELSKLRGETVGQILRASIAQTLREVDVVV
jgi:hypothetical protein